MGLIGLTKYVKSLDWPVSELRGEEELLIDGHGFCSFVLEQLEEKCRREDGGDYEVIGEHAKKLAKSWIDAGFQLTFVVDGPAPPEKMKEKKKRREQKVYKHKIICDYFEEGLKPERYSDFPAPPLFLREIYCRLQELDIKILQAPAEADIILGNICSVRENSYILGSDSDFFAMRNIRYIPFSTFEIIGGSYKACIYSADQIVERSPKLYSDDIYLQACVVSYCNSRDYFLDILGELEKYDYFNTPAYAYARKMYLNGSSEEPAVEDFKILQSNTYDKEDCTISKRVPYRRHFKSVRDILQLKRNVDSVCELSAMELQKENTLDIKNFLLYAYKTLCEKYYPYWDKTLANKSMNRIKGDYVEREFKWKRYCESYGYQKLVTWFVKTYEIENFLPSSVYYVQTFFP